MTKRPLHFIGMFGIGDNLHQRSIIVELMKEYDVWLETCHVWVYHDLIEQGLKLILRPTTLWMHAQNIETEKRLYPNIYHDARSVPRGAVVIRNWYHRHQIHANGSILDAMHGVCGAWHAPRDFRIPLKQDWVDQAQEILYNIKGKRGDDRPLMIYRPIVLRKEWDSHLRNPDPVAYTDLYRTARDDQFSTLSIASLRPNVEWIVGQEQPADYKLHDGAMTTWVMVAMFAQADMIFCNAGMAPVVAQATGRPSIVVYGGRESFKTTQRAGAHLAPTLGIDPINPCDCHSHTHQCDKRIDVPSANLRIRSFIDENYGIRHDICGHVGEAASAKVVDGSSHQAQGL